MEKKQKNVSDKPAPAAPELESAILGNILNNEDLLLQAMSILRPECFYVTENMNLFQALVDMGQKEMPIDVRTVTVHLQQTNKIEDAGGIYQLTVLASNNATNPNFEFYCFVIFEMYVKREMILLFAQETENLYGSNSDIYDIYTRVSDRLEVIFESLNDNQIKHMQSSIDKTIHEISSFQSGEKLAYIKTGVKLIDENIYLGPKFIFGIAASRGAGKTRYLIHLMRNIFMNNDSDSIAALWYTMEDSDTKIIRLFAAPDVNLTDGQMQSKGYKLSEKEVDKVKTSINKFSKYNIDFVTDQDSMATISRNFTKFTKKHSDKVCLLVIDNIMLIEDLYMATGNQVQIEDKVAASMRRIINKADKLGHEVIIIFLHHMTKEMESRSNAEEAYRPKLSHVKGSSRFVDVCNAIVLLMNPGMHKDLIKKNTELPDIKCVNSDGTTRMVKRSVLLQNMMIGEVAKNRDGEMSDDATAVERYIVDFGLMKFNELKTIK